jgi:hypothetical protein
MQGDGGFDPYPSIWKSVDVLGKAMWFSVLTDLGRNQSGVPNMLVEPTLLANLTSNYTSEIQAWPTYNDSITQRLDPGLAQASFDPNATPLPDLNATQSTLTTNYVCQVPRMKSAGTLFTPYSRLISCICKMHTRCLYSLSATYCTVDTPMPTTAMVAGGSLFKEHSSRMISISCSPAK